MAKSPHVGRQAVAQHTAGYALAGEIEALDDRELTLRAAGLIPEDGGDPTPLDGVVVVDRVHIDYLQIV